MGEKPDPCSSRNGSRNVAVNRPGERDDHACQAGGERHGSGTGPGRSSAGSRTRSTAMKAGAQDDEGDQEADRRGARPAPRLALAEGEQEREQGDGRQRRAPACRTTGPCRGVSAGSTRAAQTIASTPIGTLIRKIARHVPTWVRIPPSAGPRLRPIETLIAVEPQGPAPLAAPGTSAPRSPGPSP